MTTSGEGESDSSINSRSSSNSNRLQHDLQGNRIVNNNNKNSNNNQKKKGYKSIHTNYTPFLKYIEDHASIDDATVQLAKAKYGRISSNTNQNSNNNNNNNKMSSSVFSQSSSFASQKQQVKTRAQLDDERHADLHANTKTRDFSDKDKIFLLKREIDNLRGTLETNGGSGSGSGITSPSSSAQQQQQQQQLVSQGGGLSSVFTTNIPLLSVLLFFGVLLVATRRLHQKLRWVRSADALLFSEDGDDKIHGGNNGNNSNSNSNGRNYEYHRSSNSDTDNDNGVELRSYEAPSSAAAASATTKTTIQFV